MGSHVLGRYLPGQRSIFALSEPVFLRLQSLNFRMSVIPLFPDPPGHNLPPEHKVMEPLIVTLCPNIVPRLCAVSAH